MDLEGAYGEEALRKGSTLIGSVRLLNRIGDGVSVYRVEERYASGNVLVWRAPSGNALGAICDSEMFGDAYCVAAIMYSDSDPGMLDMASRLPDIISDDEDFDMESENIGCQGEDNRACCDAAVDRFLNKAFSRLNGLCLMETLDAAIVSCRHHRAFDASYVADMIVEKLKKRRYRADPHILKEFATRDGIRDGTWMLDRDFGFTQRAAVSLYAELSAQSPISAVTSGFLDAILGTVTDLGKLADALMGDDYYANNTAVRREHGRGHTELAVCMAESLSRMRLSRPYPLETARLLRDLGIPDDGGLFVEAFLNEPNGKRLIDVTTAHPDIDVEFTVRMAWKRGRRDPSALGFFAENGLSREVEDYIEGLDGTSIREKCTADQEGMSRLAGIMLSEGYWRCSASVCEALLDSAGARPEDPGFVARTMWMVDSICDLSGDQSAEAYCAGYARRRLPRTVWEAYGEPGNSHFLR